MQLVLKPIKMMRKKSTVTDSLIQPFVAVKTTAYCRVSNLFKYCLNCFMETLSLVLKLNIF